MRHSVIYWILLAGLLAPAPLSADVIHLKNGRQIWADRVRENGARVEYDVGDNSFAIPKSLVEAVETGGTPPESPSSSDSAGSPAVLRFVPNDDLTRDADLPSKIIHAGHVDTEALAALEKQGRADVTSAGYFIAGKNEFERGDFFAARQFFESALRHQPDSPTILNYYAATLVRLGLAREALPYAQRSSQLASNSADSLAVLGCVQFASDRTKEAIRSWKRSLELRPDPVVEHYLAKAEREEKAEADFSQDGSNHFTLHYQGRQTSQAFRRQVVRTLESEYDDLVRELGVLPRDNIVVVLYTDQAFFDVTQAPAWSGALNDGKLRIPVSGLDSVTSELARVLKHELAHSFINQISHGRCPHWLHEGLAQLLEPKIVGSQGGSLAALFLAHREIPFNALEANFANLSAGQASLAYAESLAAVECINQTYGMVDLRRILERIGEGSPTEVALRNTIHSDYSRLETEVTQFLVAHYK